MSSSSSSDSDSDEFEPIRRIKINIRPKEEVSRGRAADVSEIKASVEAWRPLGPPSHGSGLSRRHPSLSSVSSMSFGAASSFNTTSGTSATLSSHGLPGPNLHSSPSCSSLVNEFNNRSAFSNFMSTTSRTSSPLTLINHGDVVPIAIAIQESIELIVKGHYDPKAIEPIFQSRILGNIKVAFPNAFARGNYGKPNAAFKLRLHSTDNITRYYASRLIKDLDIGINSVAKKSQTEAFHHHKEPKHLSIINGNNNEECSTDYSSDLFDSSISSSTEPQTNSKIIEFDMDVLLNCLRKMYDQSPASRYYNVDVLRYQITPKTSIEECPLQVCAYWKVEAKLIKLRIEFKHSSRSGLNLERLREITFNVNFANLIPLGVDLSPLSPDSYPPYISYEPQAHWNRSVKQLTWKFDTLLSYHKTDGYGSLFAKLDFRNYHGVTNQLLFENCKPSPVDVKFLVTDSTLSKINIGINSSGYKMSLLKREIRSGRYKSEPYIL